MLTTPMHHCDSRENIKTNDKTLHRAVADQLTQPRKFIQSVYKISRTVHST